VIAWKPHVAALPDHDDARRPRRAPR